MEGSLLHISTGFLLLALGRSLDELSISCARRSTGNSPKGRAKGEFDANPLENPTCLVRLDLYLTMKVALTAPRTIAEVQPTTKPATTP